jgi:Fic family protein
MTESRTYQKSHQWLTFQVDLRRVPHGLWLMLGECQSKCAHIEGVPLQPEVAKNLHLLFLAKGALATTAIEGNTLSEEEVVKQLAGELKLPPSREYLGQEVGNIIAACNGILSEIKNGRRPVLNFSRICELNRLVLDKLPLNEGVKPGELRTFDVGVARYRGAPHQDCQFLLERLCEWLNGKEFQPGEGMDLAYAIIEAMLSHLYLAWIHPFADGNGRTARLVEFQILICSGVPAPAAHLMSNHYNQTRTEYYRQLDQASRSGGDVIPFLTYAAQGLLDGLRYQLDQIRTQQWNVAWEKYIHDAFKDKSGEGHDRMRRLVLDLSRQEEERVPLSKLPDITPRMTKAYAKRTRRTMHRDINSLSQMGLIDVNDDGVRTRKELILAFLPITAKGE